MSLHSESSGSGDPLCLLHGWALNNHVWDHVTEELQQTHQVIRFDLPGHGKSSPPASGEYTVDSLAKELSQALLPGSILFGWSLGGLVAIKIAQQYPSLVSKLILVASSPQFTVSENWDHGIKKTIIDGFAADLKENYQETIMRFLSLQTYGSEQAKPVIRELRKKVFANGEPHLDSLSKGLEILKNCSLWEEARHIDCPTLIVLGEKDTLIPSESGRETQTSIAGSQLAIMEGAGHAPFLSHPQEFIKLVSQFIRSSNHD